jgi:NAD(P)-dependent dehydrogenase (short-subunit alcohol dehydrogenase family)
VSQVDDWTRLAEEVEAEHGGADVLVNNAGLVGS